MFSCGFCEISKNIFFHRTPLVAASALIKKCERKEKESQRKGRLLAISVLLRVEQTSFEFS